MRVLMINSVCGIGSTGKICAELARKLEEEENEVKIAYGRNDTVPETSKKYAVRIGNALDRDIHALQTRLFDTHGFGSCAATKRFLAWAEEYNPDLLWLHNIHGYYINLELLFRWIKARSHMRVKWTLHDCWAFTGHCSHFIAIKCEQWKAGCVRCPQLHQYPACYGKGDVGRNFERKRTAFTGVKNMELIVPSHWLEGLVRQSFLKEYPITVRYNTIDVDVFKPTPSDFRKRCGLEGKKIVLGVASEWTERKGLSDFIRLAHMLDNSYHVVLVGLGKAQKKRLPQNILGLSRTNSSQELAKLYTAADVLFNPTYEDTYPMVNLEAQSCGTPVVTYDSGGSAETLHTEESVAVRTGDIDAGVCLIKNICEGGFSEGMERCAGK